MAWGNAQKNDSALHEYREAARLEPSADNHYYVAVCLINMGRNDEALGELEAAASIDPGQSLYRARKDELLKLMKTSEAR
jgi:tetratricopeptide (TPR) repeat protein